MRRVGDSLPSFLAYICHVSFIFYCCRFCGAGEKRKRWYVDIPAHDNDPQWSKLNRFGASYSPGAVWRTRRQFEVKFSYCVCSYSLRIRLLQRRGGLVEGGCTNVGLISGVQ